MPDEVLVLPVTRLSILAASSSALHILAAHPQPGPACQPWEQVRELYNILSQTTSLLADLRQVEREHLSHAVYRMLGARDEIAAAWTAAAPGGQLHRIDGVCNVLPLLRIGG